jgi:hypothetical protein
VVLHRGNAHEADITLLGGAAAYPVALRAQKPERMQCIAVLMAYGESDAEAGAWVRGGD